MDSQRAIDILQNYLSTQDEVNEARDYLTSLENSLGELVRKMDKSRQWTITKFEDDEYQVSIYPNRMGDYYYAKGPTAGAAAYAALYNWDNKVQPDYKK